MTISSVKSIFAGFVISIGCAVFLACDNRYVGAFLFATALCAVCTFGMHLYTGKLCSARSVSDIPALLKCLACNAVGCAVGALMIRTANPDIAAAASALCTDKLSQPPIAMLGSPVVCGFLMTVAVRMFQDGRGTSRYIGIFTCVPTFILCGFEHSVADTAFLFLSDCPHILSAVLFVIVAAVGNAVGGVAGSYMSLNHTLKDQESKK